LKNIISEKDKGGMNKRRGMNRRRKMRGMRGFEG
jgi:hypothetical protein